MIERFPELEMLSPSEKLTLASELWDQVASNPGQIPATLEQMAELKAKILAGNLGDRAGQVEAEAPNANIIELLEKRLSDYLAEAPSAPGPAEHKSVLRII
jgi:putative addiction module component (TIGR02574 family)